MQLIIEDLDYRNVTNLSMIALKNNYLIETMLPNQFNSLTETLLYFIKLLHFRTNQILAFVAYLTMEPYR